MLEHFTRLAVQRLVDDWSLQGGEGRPWGIWVLLWGAIQHDEELETLHPSVPLRAAWFLTDSGFVRREVWSYLRFQAIQNAPLEPLRIRPDPGIGVFNVAPYRGQTAVYASGSFGPRNGYGFRMGLDAHGQPFTERLWVS
ncbi:hypothetical protein NR798_25325 [Archangium gephyra]|uniref:hypothetical protein n=1 Tax=Archangium gephyra TaxID=48 RepID=UPI0035D45BF3